MRGGHRAQRRPRGARALVPHLTDVRDSERDVRAELLERALEHRELPAHERVVPHARRPALRCAPSAADTIEREGRDHVGRRATRLQGSASGRASYATCARALAVRGACRASAPSSAHRFFMVSYISCCARPHRPIRVRSWARGTHTGEEPARAMRSFNSGSICRAHPRISGQSNTRGMPDLLLLEVGSPHAGEDAVRGAAVQRREVRSVAAGARWPNRAQPRSPRNIASSTCTRPPRYAM
jgi:hypothetical protein